MRNCEKPSHTNQQFVFLMLQTASLIFCWLFSRSFIFVWVKVLFTYLEILAFYLSHMLSIFIYCIFFQF
jgi:hypothetical protein